MEKIKLTKGKFALVDDDLFCELNKYRWHLVNGYAARREYFNGKYKSKYIFMHRQINNTLDGYDTDHIDRNKLNNQRENLRTVTHRENAFNSKLSKSNTSGHKGVSWEKRTNKWKSHITVYGNYKDLGRHINIEDAIQARKEAEEKYIYV